MSRIYALSSVKFPGLKLRLCNKKDKYELWEEDQQACPASPDENLRVLISFSGDKPQGAGGELCEQARVEGD